MSRYYDAPERCDLTDETKKLATDLAAAAAACVHVHGADHIAVWDEREHRFAAGMLEQIHRHGGKIIYAGSKPLPAEGGDSETWRRHDAPEGERRGWVEVKLPEPADD